MPTIRQIADEYGVTKATVRRWITQAGIDGVLGTGKPVELTSAQMHELAMFITERQAKTALKDAEREQEQLANNAEKNELKLRIHRLEIEVAELKAQVEIERGKADNAHQYAELSRESANYLINQLTHRAEAAEAALAREQIRNIGFFKRLGMKLLGEGKGK